MTSPRKAAANRQNALRSTGPKTAQGKARVAQNAITHGLLARETLLPEENPQTLDTLAEAIRAEANPEGPREQLLVELMIRAVWRLRRLGRVEAGIFAWKHFGILADRASHEAKSYERTAVPAFDHHDQTAITDAQKHQEAMATAEQLTDLRNGPTATIGLTFIRGSSGVDAFSKLSRYEATIERSYYRALHELQRLQHARLGGHVSLPVAVDVTVNSPVDRTPDEPRRAPRQAELVARAADITEQTTDDHLEDELE